MRRQLSLDPLSARAEHSMTERGARTGLTEIKLFCWIILVSLLLWTLQSYSVYLFFPRAIAVHTPLFFLFPFFFFFFLLSRILALLLYSQLLLCTFLVKQDLAAIKISMSSSVCICYVAGMSSQKDNNLSCDCKDWPRIDHLIA